MSNPIEAIEGVVEEGRGIGRTMGFPTLNFPYAGSNEGIFVGEVVINGRNFRAAVHIGARPTFFDEDMVCESFLLDFDEEVLPGTKVVVKIYKRIRGVMKFENLEFLKKQISKDVEFVENWYNSREK